MTPIIRILLILPILLLAACAYTEVRDANGKSRYRTQADVAHIEFHSSNGDTLIMDSVNHSEPTRAGGNAFATGNDSVARGIVGGVAAANSAGLLQKVIAVGGAAIPTRATIPAAAVNPAVAQ